MADNFKNISWNFIKFSKNQQVSMQKLRFFSKAQIELQQ